MGAIAVALIGAVLFAVPGSPLYKKPVLGLDLKGGTEVILRAVPERNQSINSTQMQTARNIIEQRVNSIGVASPNVAVQGSDEIVVQLAGINDPTKAAAVVGQTGKLQFFDFETDLASPTVSGTGQPAPLPSLYGLLTTVKADAKKGKPEALYLFNVKTSSTTGHDPGQRQEGHQAEDDDDPQALQGRTTTGTSPPPQREAAGRYEDPGGSAESPPGLCPQKNCCLGAGRTASRRPARTGTSSSTSDRAAGRPS
jgi:preprotein translocase subunit SecD